jgi:PAS domain S-box-containing protein
MSLQHKVKSKFTNRTNTLNGNSNGEIFNARDEKNLLYQQLLEGLPAALYTCDREGRILSYNKAAAALWGREPEIGKDRWCGSWKIYQSDGITPLPLDSCPMAITLKEGRAVQGEEIVIERPDGVKRCVQANPSPLFDSEGKITGAVNMLVDITERKINDEKVSMLAAIVESSSDAIISKTLNGVITSWNHTAEKLFGYTASEMIGQPLTKIIPPDRLQEEPKILERLKRGEVVDHFETKRVAKDNRILDLSLTISPIRDSQGRIIGASKIARDISEKKEAEQLVRESEERFRMAVGSTKLGTWEFYPITGKLAWSKECKKIYDVPAEMELDYPFFVKHLHPDDAIFVQQEIGQAMDPSGNGNYDIQYRILRYSDKQPRWIRAQGKVYFNDQRQPERFIGTVLDITEEKTQEQQLKDSIELFQTMADNVPALIWMSGTGRFSDFFNKTWLEFTGRTLEEESNEGWLKNVYPGDVQKCRDNYRQSFNKQKGFYTEYRLKRHDGQYRWIAHNSVPRYNADGSFAGFISACMDIDDQKNFREKIEESELHFKTISNVSPVGLWMTDTHARNIFVNDTWIRWTGIPFEKQLGTGWLDRVLEEDKVEAPAKFWECLLKREKYSAEFRLQRTDGEIRWCLTEGTPFFDINGEFAGYAGSVTDITEIRKLEERKDDFIKMASHELKTPITSIKGYVQLLLNIYNELNEEKLQTSKLTVKSSLHIISKQVTKLTRLVSELLDLSRIDSGKLELNKTIFDLGDLLEETVQDVRHTTSRHAIIVRNDFEGKGNVYADKDRIVQVLLNLLTNAIKYSPDANSVEVSLEGDKQTAIIRVRDYGIGIDKKDHQKIFERFYRAEGKSELTFPGFGIGLFIASEIVQRHQGTINVQSEKNKGSLFTMTLPISKVN